jgi:hypothetical protein
MLIAPSKLPLGAEAVIRTKIVVEATDPLPCVRVREAKKFVPSVDTSKFAGASTMILPLKFAPLTVKVCAAEAVPAVVLKAASVSVTVTEGAGITVPLTATVLLLAPLLDTVMLPVGEPTLAEAERRTEIVVMANVPALGVNVRLPPKLAPSFDTSNPDGVVNVTLPVRFAPLTVKVCTAEAVPAVVLNATNVLVVVIDGGGTTVPLTATVWLVAPVLDTVILPETGPANAVALMRTETVVAPSKPPLTVKLRESAKLVPSLDTSKLAGAVTVTLPVKFAPLTVNICGAEAAPCVELKETKDDKMDSVGGNPTVPLTATVWLVAPLLETVTLPETGPFAAEAAMRTEIVVLPKVPLLGVRLRLPA